MAKFKKAPIKQLTKEQLLLFQMSQDINAWLRDAGQDKVYGYAILLNRCGDITDILKESIKKVNETLVKEGKDPIDLSEVIKEWSKDDPINQD